MKKHLLIFSSILFAGGLTAYGILNDNYSYTPQNESSCNVVNVPIAFTANILKPDVLTDFFYDFGPRFSPISKEDLLKATSVSDFIDEKETRKYDGVGSTTLIIIENDIQTDKRISGKGERLSKEQLKMIESFEYSSNFLLRAVFRTEDSLAESKGENIYYPHMTVVPEKQAIYDGGKDGLLDYFRQENEKNIYNLDEKKLQPAKLSFTVSKNGTVENAELDRTSGYPHIDEAMINLVNNLPGKWKPAENAKGESVDQVLVVSFGMVGC